MQLDYFGATTIAADSTSGSLRTANADGTKTACKRTADGSAYAAPTLLADGTAVEPSGVKVKLLPTTSRSRNRATFPADFRMTAGDPEATTARRGVGFRCAGAAGARLAGEVPDCGGGELEAVVRFPTCWDGEHGFLEDSAHVAFPNARNRCPSSHPVALPRLILTFSYDTSGLAPAAWTLSSGATAGYSAGFLNGWTTAALARLVTGKRAAG
jgi:hypothetical protein